MLDAGVLVTVNSDDPAYFGGYVADNYLAITDAFALSSADLSALAANSLAASFASRPRRPPLADTPTGHGRRVPQ